SSSDRDHEKEANTFASELLMPRRLVAPKREGDPTLAIPRSIAAEFTTSLQASSIRYVQITKSRCSVVYSERGSVVWAPKSHRFKARFAKGTAIPASSIASECLRHTRMNDEARTIEASVWFDTKEPINIVE